MFLIKEDFRCKDHITLIYSSELILIINSDTTYIRINQS